jgi:hypothetical protein
LKDLKPLQKENGARWFIGLICTELFITMKVTFHKVDSLQKKRGNAVIVDRNIAYKNIISNKDIDKFTYGARKMISPLPIPLTEDEHNVISFLHFAGLQLGQYAWINTTTSPGFKEMVKEYISMLSYYLENAKPIEEIEED